LAYVEPERGVASQGSTGPASAGGTEALPGTPAPAPSAPGAVELQEGEPAAPPSTRTSAIWTALAVGIVLLVAAVVFILQNLEKVKVTFFAVHWRIPLALDLLLAAVLGGAVVFIAGAVRMLQLRRHARRRRAPNRSQW
jgi:uncharacterized integral membrane protein